MSDWIVSTRGKVEVQQLAVSWRSFFGYGFSLVPNMPRILEFEICKLLPDYVFEVRPDSEVVDDYGNRAYAYADLLRATITFSESQYKKLAKDDPRARFTAAHELGHLLMHTGDRNVHRVPSIRLPQHQLFKSAEWQANCFASEFLVPSFIAREYPEASLLAQTTCCSLEVAENKLRDLNLHSIKRDIPDISFLDRFRN